MAEKPPLSIISTHECGRAQADMNEWETQHKFSQGVFDSMGSGKAWFTSRMHAIGVSYLRASPTLSPSLLQSTSSTFARNPEPSLTIQHQLSQQQTSKLVILFTASQDEPPQLSPRPLSLPPCMLGRSNSSLASYHYRPHPDISRWLRTYPLRP